MQGSVLKVGEKYLSGNHTVMEYEMSRKLYRQKNGWQIHSNERIFQVMTFKIKYPSVGLPVMANIAQCLTGDWERITVADPEGGRSPSPLLNIL